MMEKFTRLRKENSPEEQRFCVQQIILVLTITLHLTDSERTTEYVPFLSKNDEHEIGDLLLSEEFITKINEFSELLSEKSS